MLKYELLQVLPLETSSRYQAMFKDGKNRRCIPLEFMFLATMTNDKGDSWTQIVGTVLLNERFEIAEMQEDFRGYQRVT